MLRTEKEIAQYFKESVFVDFEGKDISSYNQIIRQRDDFYSLIDREAFSALLNDCLNDDNQLQDVFMDIFDAKLGIHKFAAPSSRTSPKMVITFFLNEDKYKYHQSDISKVYTAFNTWLVFFGADTISPEWSICPFCGQPVKGGACSNGDCKKSNSDFIKASLELAAMLADEKEGKGAPTPAYWHLIKTGAEFDIEYKREIDSLRFERNKDDILKAEAKKNEAVQSAIAELNLISANLDLEDAKAQPDFDSILRELNGNKIIQEAFKFNDPELNGKIEELKKAVNFKKQQHKRRKDNAAKAKDFDETVKNFLHYNVILEQEFSVSSKSLPRVKEAYDNAKQKYAEVVVYINNGFEINSSEISEVISRYEDELSTQVSEYITSAEHEQHLLEKQEKLSVSVNVLLNQCNSIRVGEGKAKEIEQRFNTEIECNKLFNDYRVERRSQYDELVTPIRVKISELIKLDNDQKIKDFKNQTKQLLKEVQDAKPRDMKSSVFNLQYEGIKSSDYFNSIVSSSEFVSTMNTIKSKINALAKAESAYKTDEAKRKAQQKKRRDRRRRAIGIVLAIAIFGSAITFVLEFAGFLPFEIVLAPVDSHFSGKTDGGKLSITGLKNKEKLVEIPAFTRVGWQMSASTVNKIDTDAFKNSNVLEAVELPETIEVIGSGAFAECANLHRITLNSKEPPQIFIDSFEYSNPVFYVPEESYDKYLQDTDWSVYSNRIFPDYGNDLKHVDIFFNENGGSDVSDILSHPIKSVCEDLPTPVRYGYDFDGWYYYSPDGYETRFYADSTVLNESVKLVAKWAFSKSSLIFDYSGGYGWVSDKTVQYQQQLGELPTAERDGYTFAGWLMNGADVNENTRVEWVSDITLVAKWKPNNYTVYFDYNGANKTYKNEMTVTYASKYGELPVPEKEGLNFAGWYIGDVKITSTSVVDTTSNHTLVAKWNPIQYKLVYNLDGGTMDVKETVCSYNEYYTLPIPEKLGYVFKGWEYNGTLYKSGNRIRNLSNKNNDVLTLKAVWEASINKLLFNANGGSGNMAAVQYATGDVIKLPKCTFTKKGYKFYGWALTADGKAEYTDEGGFQIGPEPEFTLYAIWAPESSKLHFNANGGSGSMSTMEFATGDVIVIPECTFTRDGYVFVGWALSNNGPVEYKEKGIYIIGTDLECTLYAIWEKL